MPTPARATACAVDETVILLHRPLSLVGVSIVMETERQQNDSLVNGDPHPAKVLDARPNRLHRGTQQFAASRKSEGERGGLSEEG